MKLVVVNNIVTFKHIEEYAEKAFENRAYVNKRTTKEKLTQGGEKRVVRIRKRVKIIIQSTKLH